MARVLLVKIDFIVVAVAQRDYILRVEVTKCSDKGRCWVHGVRNAIAEEAFLQSIGHDYAADPRLRVLIHGMPTLRRGAGHIADVVVCG